MVVTSGASVVAVVVVGVVCPVVAVNSGFSVVFVAIVVRPGPGPGVVKVLTVVNSGPVGFVVAGVVCSSGCTVVGDVEDVPLEITVVDLVNSGFEVVVVP